MALMGLFGKKRITESFFVNAFGNNQTRGIYTFQLDVDNGEILYKNLFETPSNPVFAYKYGRFVCITYKNRSGSASDGGVCSYAMTADTLMLASRVSDEGKTYVCVCTNGEDSEADRLFGVDYYNGQVMMAGMVKRKLVVALDTYSLHGSSVDKIKQTQPHPSYCLMTPDNKKLIVSDLGQDKIFFFEEEKKNLKLNLELTVELEPGSGPKKIMFNKDNNVLYVLNEISSTIQVFKYNDYKLELIQTISSYPKDDGEYENEAADFILSEDNKKLFAVNSGHDSLVLFNVADDGKLEYVDFADTSAKPISIEIFNDRWLVVACKKGGIIESYEYVDEKNGLLFETKYSYTLNEPVFVSKFNSKY